MRVILAIYLSAILCMISCNADITDPSNPILQKQEPLPIIMIHGALASGDTYAKQAMLFTSNGYQEELLFAFDWNSLGGSNAEAIADLDKLIDTAIKKSGKSQVYLMGHSAGGGLGYNYCTDAKRALKIKKYVHLASNPQTKPAGPMGEIQMMNIYSTADKVVAGSDIPMATNIKFEDLDHYEVATSDKSFAKIYEFLLDEKPLVNYIKKQTNPKINGRVVTLGENKPSTNIKVNIYALDSLTGARNGEAITTFVPDNLGNFGPYSLDGNTYYEFEVISSDIGFRPIHYFREKFIHNNPLVYLRIFPPATSIGGLLLSNLPNSDDQSVIGIFSANKAMINKRDSVQIANNELVTSTLGTPQNSMIALFLYDNGDQKSSNTPHAAFSFFPFLKASDIFTTTACSEGIPIVFNKRKLVVRNFKSKSEGVVIAAFE
jgi:hypothetical protein